MIFLLPLALLAVPVVLWLFPENTNNHNHYDGNFGDTEQTLKSWDELTTAEKDDLWNL